MPEVFIGLGDTIHIDGQVAVPIRTILHTGQSWEVGHQQAVVHQVGEGHNPLYPQCLFLCVEVFQVFGDEIAHANGVTLLHMQTFCGHIRQNHLLSVQRLSMPFVHCCHKGIRNGVGIVNEVVDKV